MTDLSKPPAIARRLLDHIARRSSIRQTLVAILLIALTPLVILAIVQSQIRISVDRDQLLEDLRGTAMRAADTETAMLEQLQYGISLVANNPNLVANDSRNCASVLADAALRLPDISAMKSVDGADNVLCQWDNRATPTAHSITMQAMWRHGDKSGRLLATIDLARYQTHLMRLYTSAAAIAILSPSGDVLVRSRTLPAAALPVRPSEQIVDVKDKAGDKWLIGTAPLIPVNSHDAALLLVVAQRDPGWTGRDQWILITSFLLPLLAVVLASLALWWAGDWVLLRWIDNLRDAARKIGDGSYGMPAGQFDDAPDEFRTLAAAMQQMARTIAKRDESLRVTVDKQRALAFELNHRVRNNLQVIGSYLALDATATDQSKKLENTRLRVAALALVQRLLYDRGEMVLVPAEPLLRALAAQVSRHFQLATNVTVPPSDDELAFDIDTASTLALYLVEAFSALCDADQAMITVTNKNDGVETSISWSDGPTAEVICDSPLMKGFAGQLSGSIEARGPRTITFSFPRVRTFKPVVKAAPI
jgi:two-component sensor histidine kinase